MTPAALFFSSTRWIQRTYEDIKGRLFFFFFPFSPGENKILSLEVEWISTMPLLSPPRPRHEEWRELERRTSEEREARLSFPPLSLG